MALVVSACSGGGTERTAHRDWPIPEALPGAQPFDSAVRDRLHEALATQTQGYEPRTRHRRADGSPVYTNRLILESSPYLLQHAHNPVNWQPWSDEAFETARRLNRPVFLSVGYSTCHWCHVMERESFEDPEVARIINAYFVPVKVDREERPDVDAVYMEVVQMLTGGGGWPMTVVMTPDREPFFGGTYFPARRGDRGSGAGLVEILEALATRHRDDPASLVQHAKGLTQRLREASLLQPAGDLPDASVIRRASAQTAQIFDAEWGGFGRAPKFPRTVTLELLLRYHRRTNDAGALERVTKTLDQMARGGIRDHVGGGFHRYSTDRAWLVPHFEKMLYDNALLATAYLEAYQVTGEQRFAEVAREMLDYLAREMTSPEGGFYSATDADSETPEGEEEEGWFFTWTPAEIAAVVGEERARLIASRHGVTEEGNFEGRSILYAARPIEEVATAAGLSVERATAELTAARAALYDARAKRPAPLRDDKILAAWNGLAISAFALGARVLHDESYARRASAAADFVLQRMGGTDGLQRSFRDGTPRHAAVLEDYAFLIAGLLDLYEATFDPRRLDEALALQETLDDKFWDDEHGGYFFTPDGGEALLVRQKEAYDGATPSGNSVAVTNLLRLYELTTEEIHRERAARTLAAFAGSLDEAPLASPRLLSALDFYLDSPKEVILVRPSDEADVSPFVAALGRRFLPNAIIATTSEGKAARDLASLVPLVEGKNARDGRVTAYVCEQRTCALPTTSPEVFAEQIATVRPYPG